MTTNEVQESICDIRNEGEKMTNEELMQIKSYNKEKEEILSIDHLINKEDRTLLYGYTCDRETWHVYLKHKKIHAIKYKNNYIRKCPVYVEKILICDNSDYIPNKRLYPTACDYEFCMRLKERGYELPFTSPDDREKTQYYGYTLEDVIPVCVSCKGNKNPYEYCQKCKKENR